MRPDPSEQNMISLEFESETVEQVDAAFPPILMTFHFLDSERRVSGVLYEDAEFFFKGPLSAIR